MSNEREDLGECIWINAKAMLESKGSMTCHGMVMDFLTVLWMPTKAPFEFDPEAIAKRMNAIFTRREYTAQKIRDQEKDLREFFVVLPDGRWAPSPVYFVINDPYAEGGGS